MDCNLQGSSVHGIFQARVLEWVAISFSRGPSWPRDQTPDLLHCRQMLYHLSHQVRRWLSRGKTKNNRCLFLSWSLQSSNLRSRHAPLPAGTVYSTLILINFYLSFKNHFRRTSLVMELIWIDLSMQGTWVESLVWEDSTCHRATKFMHTTPKPICSKACQPQLTSPSATATEAPKPYSQQSQLLRLHAATIEAHVPRAYVLQQEMPPQWEAHAPQIESSPHSLHLEEACMKQWRPRLAKNK